MLRKTIPAAFAVVLLSSCGSSDVPPWLLDNGNPGDAGKDALSDVIHNDTTPDSTTDVPRDIREVWQDMVVDTGSDIRDTIGDDGAAVDDGRNDAVDAQSDPGYTDAVNDVSDAVDARDADVTIDIDIGIGWECGRDDDCVPPADLGTCEKMTCTGHVCVRGDKPDLETCNVRETTAPAVKKEEPPLTLFGSALTEELLALDVMSLTPIEALNALFRLQNQAKEEMGR